MSALISTFGLERKTKSELQWLWKECTGHAPHPSWRKSALISGIKARAADKIDQHWAESQKPKIARSLCEITAAEVNDWLRTLPREEAA